MKTVHILQTLKQCFEKVLPANDGRTEISPLEFVVSLIFSLLGDAKKATLEGLRREMMAHLEVSFCRSSFWERLSRPRLHGFLKNFSSK